MNQPIQKKRGRRVVQSNQLTEASYSLTRDQKRILYLCMSKMPNVPEGEPITHDGKFTIAVADYAEAYDLPSSAASQDIRTALNRFRGKEVTIYRPEFDEGDDKGYDAYPWLVKRSVRPNIGLYEIHINQELMPLMAGLRRNFTTYDMIEVNGITNPLVMRLYESLCQFRGNRSEGTVTLSVEWIRARYMLPASYNRMPDFRKRFLDVAVQEINQKSQLRIEVKEKKTGRSITHLEFKFVDIERKKMEGIKRVAADPESGQTDLKQALDEGGQIDPSKGQAAGEGGQIDMPPEAREIEDQEIAEFMAIEDRST